MCIKSDAKSGQQHLKWLFAVSELSKMGIGFTSISLLKARVLNLTISKQKALRLPLKVCLLFGFTRVSLSKFVAFHPLTVKQIVTVLMPSLLFRCFFTLSAWFKNSSPREKVGKLSSFWDRWAESLFVSIIVPKYNILPRANNGRSREKTKKFWLSDLLTPSAWACTIKILTTLAYTEFDCVALLAML